MTSEPPQRPQFALLMFRLPANRAKHLARVAAEYTQLLYHVSKAKDEKCVFINGIQWVCAFWTAPWRLANITFSG